MGSIRITLVVGFFWPNSRGTGKNYNCTKFNYMLIMLYVLSMYVWSDFTPGTHSPQIYIPTCVPSFSFASLLNLLHLSSPERSQATLHSSHPWLLSILHVFTPQISSLVLCLSCFSPQPCLFKNQCCSSPMKLTWVILFVHNLDVFIQV